MLKHADLIRKLVAGNTGIKTHGFTRALSEIYLREKLIEFYENHGHHLKQVPDAYEIEQFQPDTEETCSAADGAPVRYRITVHEVEVTSFMSPEKWKRYSFLWDELAAYGIDLVIKTTDRHGITSQHDMAEKYFEALPV